MSDKEAQITSAALTSTSSSSDLVVSDQDALDMAKLGKIQQLLRHFNFLSILGFACTTMITWEGLLAVFIYGLQDGGPAGLIYGFLFVWLGYGFAVASLAEMMSMYPTSGGQYHWTYTLAPKAWAPFLSYVCGWQSVLAWQSVVSSACYLSATMIQGTVVLNYPEEYRFERWHGTLMMYALLIVVVGAAFLGNRVLPKSDVLALFIHIAGFVVILVVFAVLSPSTARDGEVFGVWYNAEYPSQGLSFLVGLQGTVFAWLGADGPIHMAEEIKDASKVVPRFLLSSIAINGVLGFGMMLAILYYGPSGDALTAALNSPTGYPYEAIFACATGSVASGTGLSMIMIIMACLATLMIFIAASRELWAFARDNGVPAAQCLARIDKKTRLPLYSIALTATVEVLLALINIGSAVAFNAVIALSVAGYIGSYAFPLVLLIWRKIQAARGKGPRLPYGP